MGQQPTHVLGWQKTKADAKVRAKILIAFFGPNCEVASLTENDVESYTRKRIAGGIRYEPKAVTGAVRARSAEADLVLLRSMIRLAS